MNEAELAELFEQQYAGTCVWCALTTRGDKNVGAAIRRFDHPSRWGHWFHAVREKFVDAPKMHAKSPTRGKWITAYHLCDADALRFHNSTRPKDGGPTEQQ